MAKQIVLMGKFTAIGMRRKVSDPTALVINTCGKNDTAERGTFTSWVWGNPTNRAITHEYMGYKAVSTEALWQGMKIFEHGGWPNEEALAGDWRQGKGGRPIGAWNGEDSDPDMLTDPGSARRAIYLPAFERQIRHWLRDDTVREWVHKAHNHPGNVFLRDHDTGRGVDRRGPMSHAWVLAVYLNTGSFPG
jgi:hypothetical protein